MNRLDYVVTLADLRVRVEDRQKNQFDLDVRAQTLSPSVTLGLTYFLGFLGIDRFRIGLWGTGLLKLCALPVLILSEWAVIQDPFGTDQRLVMYDVLGTIVQILLYCDGFFTPGLTRRYNAQKLKSLFPNADPRSPEAPPASSDS